MAAALAGVLVKMLMKQQRAGRNTQSRGETSADVGPDTSYDESTTASAGRPDEVIADTNIVGDGAATDGQQPQDWRGAQNVTGP